MTEKDWRDDLERLLTAEEVSINEVTPPALPASGVSPRARRRSSAA